MLKGMEKLAEEFSSDPEQVLPEAGPLESARAYREKKGQALMGEDRQGAAVCLSGLLRPQIQI